MQRVVRHNTQAKGMKEFMGSDFLLQTETARKLFHEHSEGLPIIDYHCHLNPKHIAEDHRYRSITELWLDGDHYKWRAMRANGVDERYITGDVSDWERFQKWAETIPYALCNPLYHWTHMELRTAFGITETLNPESARRIFDACNEKLAGEGMTARDLMRHYKVEVVCTTDDPTDTLEYHKSISESGFEVKVLPSWRPDKAIAVNGGKAYLDYISKLSDLSGVTIMSLSTLLGALQNRHDYFASLGCKVADNGISAFPWAECEVNEASALFDKVFKSKTLSGEEVTKLQTYLLLELARMNNAKGWVQQYHFGPMRNVNTRMFRKIGVDAGFDTIGDYSSIEAMARFFDKLDSEGKLAKTILYNLNPVENSAVAALAASFQDGTTPGKMQFGTGWWFNDHIRGMEQQMRILSEQGLLSRFVGMLTDSRSFLSYPRHDYFRRILCNLLGNDIESGMIPKCETKRVEQMVEDICYYNAKSYFGF